MEVIEVTLICTVAEKGHSKEYVSKPSISKIDACIFSMLWVVVGNLTDAVCSAVGHRRNQ